MNNTTLLAIDLAKDVFQLHGENKAGTTTITKKVRRNRLLHTIRDIDGLKTIVMEACGGANHWARTFSEMGIDVKLISPQHVTPFVRTNKNDANDACAIATAAKQDTMKFVTHKTIEQQDTQVVIRTRNAAKNERTMVANRIRGFLAEYGITIPVGIHALRKNLPDILEDADNKLSPVVRTCLNNLYQQLLTLFDTVLMYDNMLDAIVKQNDICKRIMKIPGVGPITAATLFCSMGNPDVFKNGRHFAAFVGLVPKQYSSGSKQILLGISKRGDKYLRQLLVHGARSVINASKNKTDKLSLWVKALIERRGVNRAAVALANKMARVAWALVAKNQEYCAAV